MSEPCARTLRCRLLPRNSDQTHRCLLQARANEQLQNGDTEHLCAGQELLAREAYWRGSNHSQSTQRAAFKQLEVGPTLNQFTQVVF